MNSPQLVSEALRHRLLTSDSRLSIARHSPLSLVRDRGVTILIVEQKVREVLNIAHRAYVLRNGQISFNGPATSLDDAKLREVYF